MSKPDNLNQALNVLDAIYLVGRTAEAYGLLTPELDSALDALGQKVDAEAADALRAHLETAKRSWIVVERSGKPTGRMIYRLVDDKIHCDSFWPEYDEFIPINREPAPEPELKPACPACDGTECVPTTPGMVKPCPSCAKVADVTAFAVAKGFPPGSSPAADPA